MRNYEDRPAAYDLDMSERNFSCAWDRTTHTPAGQILVLSPFLMLLLFARLISKRVARDDRPLRMPPGMPLRSRQPESRRHFFGTGGRVPFVNDVVSRFGYLPDDVRGEPIIAIVPPDDCVAAMNRVNERRTGERGHSRFALFRTNQPRVVRRNRIAQSPARGIFLLTPRDYTRTERVRASSWERTVSCATSPIANDWSLSCSNRRSSKRSVDPPSAIP